MPVHRSSWIALALLTLGCADLPDEIASDDVAREDIQVSQQGLETQTQSTAALTAPTSVSLPPVNAAFDYQLGGAYTPPAGVKIVSRGLYNICYINGFQSQPDDEDFWLEQHPELVLRDDDGDPVVDEDWGELLLDPSTAKKREQLATIIGRWIAQCAKNGFQAVEIDNLDSFSRSGGLLKQDAAVALMRKLSDIAHANKLAIAQKNAVELAGKKASLGTDFAIAEECNAYNECAGYTRAYGQHVLIVEYKRAAFERGCGKYPNLSIVLRDVNLTKPGARRYVYEGC
jgi:hypothetical protein